MSGLFDRPGPIPDSDLWLFVSRDEVVVCCLCKITRGTRVRDLATRDLDEMLAHLDEHRDAGHRVPNWLAEHLRTEWRNLPWITNGALK